jgi:hypothetical protein
MTTATVSTMMEGSEPSAQPMAAQQRSSNAVQLGRTKDVIFSIFGSASRLLKPVLRME